MGGDLSYEQRACGSQWCCFRQLVWETKPGLSASARRLHDGANSGGSAVKATNARAHGRRARRRKGSSGRRRAA